MRDFNFVIAMLGVNLMAFNKLWEQSLRSDMDFAAVGSLEKGHTFKFSRLLEFILRCAHTFFAPNGLSELLEKMEFSKGT